MKVTSIATVEGKPWQITSPAGEPPLRFFRRIARLRFETGDMTDRIEIDHEAATLKAAFGPFDYDALSPSDDSLKAKLAASGGAVFVTLDAPRRVTELRLSPGNARNSIHVHRLDGDTLADKPTVIAKVEGDKPTVIAKVEGGPVAHKKIPSVAVATLPENFTDRRFAIRLEESADKPLEVGGVLAINIRTNPTGPRLGLAAPEDTDSALFFWQVAGEVSADQGNVEVGEAFGVALQRYLDDFFIRLAGLSGEEGHPPPRPEFVEVDLVAASDAPCVLDVTAFDVEYHLVAKALFSEEGENVEKQVLRFPGGSVTIQEVSLRLPSNAAVESATLETAESFQDDRLLASGNGDCSPNAALTQREGVNVGVGRWAAQGVTPSHAISVSGIVLALMATLGNTQVLVELREDWRGQPSGRELAAGTIMLEHVGQRSWVTLLFPEPLVLPSIPHWILMRAAVGHAVWLVDSGNNATRVFETSDNPATWAEQRVLSGLQAMYGFLSHSRRAQDEQQPVSLAIGGDVMATIDKQDGTQTYDLASAINRYLDSIPTSATTVAVPLTLTATSRGLITLYPPTIRYDLR